MPAVTQVLKRREKRKVRTILCPSFNGRNVSEPTPELYSGRSIIRYGAGVENRRAVLSRRRNRENLSPGAPAPLFRQPS